MSPFDLPPSTPPVSFDPPPNHGRRRSWRRRAAVAAASVGLVAGGVVVVSQLASADESEPVAQAASVGSESIGTTPPTPAPAPTTVPPETPDQPDTDTDAGDGTNDLDGQIVIKIGDEPPIVIDLGELGNLGDLGDLGDLGQLGDLGELGDLGDLGKIEECIGHPLFDIDVHAGPGHGPLGGFDVFGDGDVTLTGPDGVSVLDFGDGDGSVTITQKDGELTITSEGDVDVQDLQDLAESLQPGDVQPGNVPPPPSMPDFQKILDCLAADAG